MYFECTRDTHTVLTHIRIAVYAAILHHGTDRTPRRVPGAKSTDHQKFMPASLQCNLHQAARSLRYLQTLKGPIHTHSVKSKSQSII